MSHFKDLVNSLTTHRFLLAQFSSRDFTARYKGTYFGLLWSVLLPLIMVSTYTFVFGFVFKSRWSHADEGRLFFATTMFAGLIPFNFFADVLTSSAYLVQSNTNLVKKVIFPLEILPLSRVISSIQHSLISLFILCAILLIQGTYFISWIWLPVILIPFALFCTGLSFFVAALAVFIRDISHILGTVVSLSLFLSPIFYPVESIPKSIQSFVFLNPIAIIAESMRRVMIFGSQPDLNQLTYLWIFGIISFLFGSFWFQKLKSSFADVM